MTNPEPTKSHQVIIIGAGPAGLTAALYAARANLKPLVLTGDLLGGQLTETSIVENFPGFNEGVQGPDLMVKFEDQAKKFGAEIKFAKVTTANLSERPFKLTTDAGPLEAETIIIATGAAPKKLGLESETRLTGHGVATCATCDGYLFSGQPVVVVGGGDAAMEEAIYLARITSGVTVVHRGDTLRASQVMQDRALHDPKIKFIWSSEVVEFLGQDNVEAVRLRNVNTKTETTVDTKGVFISIGHIPQTEAWQGQLELDEHNYLKVQYPTTVTSTPGVFAAGDVADSLYRQAVTAAGMGCQAAIDAERFLTRSTAKPKEAV